jgi:hypothetical protein
MSGVEKKCGILSPANRTGPKTKLAPFAESENILEE